MPCFSIQSEIVEVLDYFSNLQNCIDSECHLRIAQFQNYLEHIMKDPSIIDRSIKDSDIHEYYLSDVARIVMGTSPKSQFISSDPIGIEFHQGNTSFGDGVLEHSGKYTSSPIKTAKSGSLLMSVRAPVGDIAFTNRDVAIGRGLCSIEAFSEVINVKYLYYFLKFSADEIKKGTFGSMFESIDSDSVSSIVVKVPPISIQNQIAEILDYFANLVCNIRNESISRRLQFEYCIRMLFSFRGDVV